MIASNGLPASVFFITPEIQVVPQGDPSSNGLPASVFFITPEVQSVLTWTDYSRLTSVPKPARTPNPRNPETLMVLTMPADSRIAGWRLKSIVIIQLSHARKQSVAITWLEGLVEYGTGVSNSDAISDLIVSLGEYLESLEQREAELGDSALRELTLLRNLIEKEPSQVL